VDTALATGTLAAVTDTDPLQARIDALEAEVERHPEITKERLARAAGVSYQTWRNVVTGKSRKVATIESFEAALRDLVEHPEDIAEEPTHAVSSPEGLMEFEVTGDFGVRVVVRGPVGNADELEAAAAKILRDMRAPRD
jgi:hypothetical protein